jgi:hypothetical protein
MMMLISLTITIPEMESLMSEIDPLGIDFLEIDSLEIDSLIGS